VTLFWSFLSPLESSLELPSPSRNPPPALLLIFSHDTNLRQSSANLFLTDQLSSTDARRPLLFSFLSDPDSHSRVGFSTHLPKELSLLPRLPLFYDGDMFAGHLVFFPFVGFILCSLIVPVSVHVTSICIVSSP